MGSDGASERRVVLTADAQVSTIFLTGATGLVGSELLRRILTWDTGATVVLLVRARRRQGADQRVDALLDELFPEDGLRPNRRRVRVVEGELGVPRFGLTPPTFEALGRDLTHVYHLGADVRFDLPLDVARSTHVQATSTVLDIAEAAATSGDLERFHHVSTFAAGRRDGTAVVPELPPLLTRVFRNSYEQTKAEAEAAVLERSGEVPITIHRLGIVVGDSRTGWTSKFDAFYLLIRLLLDHIAQGLRIERLPVPARALLNAIPVDFTADALYALGHGRRDQSGEILNYTAGAQATTVARALQLWVEHFMSFHRTAGTVAPPLPELVPVEDATPETMADVFRDEVSAEVIDVMDQLMPYGFDTSLYDNRNMLAALESTPLALRPIADAIRPLVGYVLRTNWGNPHEARPPLAPPPA